MSELLVESVGAIRILTLNRPDKRNALNDGLVADVKAALTTADKDDSLRAVVIRGAGKDFCSGADLSALMKIAGASYEQNLDDAKSLADLFAMPRKMKVPVIAAVHGRALAGGCGLATACDIVLSTQTAVLGYPEVKIGFVPAIVTAFLRRNVSEKRAFELLTRGFEFTAQEANHLGLINRIYPEEAFDTAVIEYASAYTKLSASAVQLTKHLLYQMDNVGFENSISLGAKANAEARMTEDCQKGIARFLDKS
ncbi:MAG: enoyl-CoA hydratase-related protein [bacterium]|nr:enoyl-CoA hydratase-related protein [bacterium]